MRRLIVSLFSVLLIFNLRAQQPASWSSADMYLALKKLNVLGSVLYVAAHPDDENTRLIAYFSKDRLYRTGYLSMTRGDGGQNLIGNDQGIDLGLIRTQELLAARRIDGGEQFFTRAFDFGFSKNPEETFAKWDKEKILSDVVWVVRKFQPDVIITRFPTTGEGGHGHHTASAILANEAFKAAADPSRFPDQFKYVKPWQAKRILWNTFNFGGTNTQSNDQFKFDVGGYNPLLGKGYGEIAAESRSQHKSQGFGVPAGRGEAIEYFKTTGGDAPVNDLFDGVDLSWKKIKGGDAIEKIIDGLLSSFDFLHPDKSVKGLVELYKAINNLPDGYWKEKKKDEVQQLIEQCSGLWTDVFATEQFAVQTDSIRINFQFNNRLGVNATVAQISVDGFDSTLNQPLLKNKNTGFSKTFFVPPTKAITQPYWLVQKMEEGHFNVSDQTKIGIPDIEPSYLVKINLNVEGTDLAFTTPVKYKFTDPVRGELYWPLVVTPPVIISPAENLKIVIKDKENPQGSIFLKGMKKDFRGRINAVTEKDNKPVEGFSFNPQQFVFGTRNQTMEVIYKEQMEAKNADILFQVTDSTSHGVSLNNKQEIKHDHIPAINYFHDAYVAFRSVDVKIYGKKIGYIPGAGDKVPEALEQIGYEVNRLTPKELSKNDLSKFDAIITGVRAYNTNEWLANQHDKLMNYVEQGGNLIVQYNTINFISSVSSKIGPYKFSISRNRVTDENAAVNILKPGHPALNFPNKITQDDFKGWIQERSIYDAADWDKDKFETIISMNDPGEKADEGSLLTTKYGKGYFTYTGLVFFRELPAGVSGAYRLLANLIALNRKKAF